MRETQILYYTVFSCGEYHNNSTYCNDKILKQEDAINMYNTLHENTRLCSIPALGVRLITKDDDIQLDLLSGRTLDLFTLSRVPELNNNKKVQEFVNKIIEAYPNVRILK